MSIFDKLTAIFQRQQMDRELDAELQAHIQMATEDLIAEGHSAEEARRLALVRLGGLEQSKEVHRDARGLPFLDALLQDVRYALRALRRDLGFTIFATLIVGLGAGACSAVFSIVNTVLVKPLPFRDPERLVWIANRTKQADSMSARTLQVGPMQKMNERNQSFEEMAAFMPFFSPGGNRLSGDGSGEPERLTGIPVSERFFPLLGIQPLIGRHFTTEECKFGAPPVTLLTYSFWQRRLGGDPNIFGRTLRIDDQLVTVAGVMPESFDFASVFTPGVKVDLFFPFPLSVETNRWGNTLSVVGRLKPGAALGSAQSELDSMAPRINGEDLRANRIDPVLTPLSEYVSLQIRAALMLLVCAVGVVMLIVCANLANLMMARTSARQREMAIRSALGAGGGRLVRQLVTESILLTGFGAILAIGVAYLMVGGISRLNVFNLPLLSTVRVEPRVLAFAVVLSMLTGVLLGLASAMRAARMRNLSASLSQRGSDGGAGSTDGSWISASLVVSEIAFAAVLLVGAGLLVRSFLQVLDTHLGFRPQSAASIRAEYAGPLRNQGTPEAVAARTAWLNDALQRVRKINGVEDAAMADALPLGKNRTWGAGEKGKSYPPGEFPLAFIRLVTDGYLRSMGVQLKQGRDFTQQDVFDSAPVMLVNESLARSLSRNGESPIGKVIANSCGKDREIVGVVEDVRHLALERASGNEMYLPMRQCRDSMANGEIVVRSSLPFGTLAAEVESALKPVAPDLRKGSMQPLHQLVDRAVSPRRFIVMLLAGFAGFALLLASLGIYGLISYSVTRRTQEIGIRMALGESAFGVQKRIVLRTLALAGIGIAAGALASGVLARWIATMLYGVSPLDPVAFAGAAAVLLLIAMLAGYLPARVASRTDPIICLRAD